MSLPITFLPDDLPFAGPTAPLRARADALLGRGRIAMSQAPGMDGDLGEELAEASRRGVTHVLSLVEDLDLSFFHVAPEVPPYMAAFETAGLTLTRHPIPDRCVPGSMTAFISTIDALLVHVRAGQSILVHCIGGIGRTGLTVACALVALGARAEEAVAMVRATNPRRIETRGQREFVDAFARARS
ncbi:MAG: tyrosine-protein phosphatase [Myxococcota bacterium]|nr:tyrosine-protein phosphatase [Myxococcota bacterium]